MTLSKTDFKTIFAILGQVGELGAKSKLSPNDAHSRLNAAIANGKIRTAGEFLAAMSIIRSDDREAAKKLTEFKDIIANIPRRTVVFDG